MRKIFYFLTIGILILGACSQEEVVVNKQTLEKEKYVLNLRADMKGTTSSNKTKLATTEDAANQYVYVNWEVGDVINLLFVQIGEDNNVNKAKADATIASVGADGSATFNEVDLPAGIDPAKSFDLYATAGGVGLDPTDITKFVMKTDVGIGRMTADAIDNDVALVASLKNLQISKVPGNINLSFKHIGSLLYVNVMNISSGNQSLIFDSFFIRGLKSDESNADWLYSSNAKFDLLQDKFIPESAQNDLFRSNADFAPTTTYTLSSQSTVQFWQWVPIVNESIVEKLDLNFKIGNTVSEKIQTITPINGASAKRFNINILYDKGDFIIVEIPVIRFHLSPGYYSKTIKVSQLSNSPRYGWVDLNQNKIREAGEIIANNGWGTNSFTIPSTGYLEALGPIGEIKFESIGITKLELIGNPLVYLIDLSQNNLSYEEMGNLIKQLPDRSGSGISQGTLKVTGNTPSFDATQQNNLRNLTDTNGKTAQNKNWTIIF